MLASPLYPSTKRINVWDLHLLSGFSREAYSVVEEDLQALCQDRAISGQQRKMDWGQVSLAFEEGPVQGGDLAHHQGVWKERGHRPDKPLSGPLAILCCINGCSTMATWPHASSLIMCRTRAYCLLSLFIYLSQVQNSILTFLETPRFSGTQAISRIINTSLHIHLQPYLVQFSIHTLGMQNNANVFLKLKKKSELNRMQKGYIIKSLLNKLSVDL